MTGPAFLLLKPDCLELGLADEVLGIAEREGLTVRSQHLLRLQPGDVRALWQEYRPRDHVLAVAFLDHYLCTATSRAVLLEGDQPFEQARRVKRVVRSTWARGIFANVVHAAESTEELTRQGRYLFGDVSRHGLHWPDHVPVPTRLRPAGHDFREVTDVPGLVRSMWAELGAGLPETPCLLLDQPNGSAQLFLGVDNDNSLDSAVTAIWRTFPDVEMELALRTALYAGRSGGHPVARGEPAQIDALEQGLRSYGIVNCWVA